MNHEAIVMSLRSIKPFSSPNVFRLFPPLKTGLVWDHNNRPGTGAAQRKQVLLSGGQRTEGLEGRQLCQSQFGRCRHGKPGTVRSSLRFVGHTVTGLSNPTPTSKDTRPSGRSFWSGITQQTCATHAPVPSTSR
jgi:hypothetical protein